MKIILLYLLSIAFLIAPVASKSTHSSTNKEFLLAWWNVENLFDTKNDPQNLDGEFTPNGKKGWTKKRLKKKLSLLANAIKDLSNKSNRPYPDIMFFSEVETQDLLYDLYKNHLHAKKFKLIYHKSKDIRGINIAAVYNPESFTLVETRYIRIHLEKRPTRDILMAKFFSEGSFLYVFANHWPSRYSGKTKTEGKRIIAAKTLRKSIEAVLKKDLLADIIVLGDFNDSPYNTSIVKYLKTTSNLQRLDGTSALLYNMSTKNSEKGTLEYKRRWYKFDQALVSKGLFHPDGFSTSQDSFSIFSPNYMFTIVGKKKLKKTVFRTFYGLKYLGGYSDHLPISLKITQKKQHSYLN